MPRFPISMVFILSFLLILSAVSGTPVAPCGFYGSVTVNGEPAPEGTVITAYIGDTESGSIITVNGEYGTNGNLLVSRGGISGDIVSFYVKIPSMQAPAKASETALWEPGLVMELNLSVQALAAGPGSATYEEPDEETAVVPEQQEIPIDLDMNMSRSILLSKAQSGNIKLNDNLYLFRVKSLSDFGILMVFDDSEEIIINLHDTKTVDLTGDYVTDVGISLDSVHSGIANLTFVRLEKNPLGAGTEGISGFLIANPVMGSLMIIALIALFGGAYYVYRGRGSRQAEAK